MTKETAKAQEMFTDAVMGAPAQWLASAAQLQNSIEHAVYLYNFPYVDEAEKDRSPSTGNASEIPYVFASWDSLGVIGRGLKPTEIALFVTSIRRGRGASFAKMASRTGPTGRVGPPTPPTATCCYVSVGTRPQTSITAACDGPPNGRS